MAFAFVEDDLSLDQLNSIFKLFSAGMVFFMHTGWAMLETGSIRYESIPGVLSKNVVALCVGFLCWWGVGYSLSTASDLRATGDFNEAFDLTSEHWFFGGTFCVTSATIASGAVAERMSVRAFAVYVVIFSSFVYPVVSHWCWSGAGILSYVEEEDTRSIVGGVPFRDFAGSTVVHMTGGIGALLGAIAVGPREDRFLYPEAFHAHNISTVVMATLLMWFSWFSFNSGSIRSLHEPGAFDTLVLVTGNTCIAPAVSCMVVWALNARESDPSVTVAKYCNGLLAGCVSITGSCGFVEAWAAVPIGFIGACIYQGTSKLVERCRVDDPLDAFAIHGACGAWGTLAVGMFSHGNGLVYGGDQILVQLLGMVIVAAWCFCILGPIFWVMKKFHFLIERTPIFMNESVGNSPMKSYALDNSPPRGYLTEPNLSAVSAMGQRNGSAEAMPAISRDRSAEAMPAIREEGPETTEETLMRIAGKVEEMSKVLSMSQSSSRKLRNLEQRIHNLEKMKNELNFFRDGTVRWRGARSPEHVEVPLAAAAKEGEREEVTIPVSI